MTDRSQVRGLISMLAAAVFLTGCSGSPEPATDSRATPPIESGTPTASATQPTRSPAPRPSPSEATPDPRWQFHSSDKRWHRSPWFAGRHRIMIGFGCNDAPWYDHDSRCPGTEGFHHGIDVAMSCGTPLRAGAAGVVLAPDAPGAPGAAYGTQPFRIRVTHRAGAYDVLIAHADHVTVGPGQEVRRGQRIALASDSGAPDGCHLHFEVRPAGGRVDDAVDPSPWLKLDAD